MDPMNQSAQISSSQGFADGQNSATKEPKLSDSFLSSSPVSLIQSPQDRRGVLGSDKPCESVATSLRFPPQPGSISHNAGSEVGSPNMQPDSPIKLSPVSERIKALEALAAKTKEPDFRSDGSYCHFRDRHYDKSPTEAEKSPITPKFISESKKIFNETKNVAFETKVQPDKPKACANQDPDSPESPFEVLGDLKQGSDFEETEQWLKTYAPPAPDFAAEDSTSGFQASVAVPKKEVQRGPIPVEPAFLANVPEAYMDSPDVNDEKEVNKEEDEEESDFDLSFLPTAYMWNQQDKPSVKLSNPDAPAPFSAISSSAPDSPPDDAPYHSVPNIGENGKVAWADDVEHREASEVDSSESDETVIEDGVTVTDAAPSPSNDDACAVIDVPATPALASPEINSEGRETSSARSERKLMQVPTINVIETDEPNYSDEEMEFEDDYDVAKDATNKPDQEVVPSEPRQTHPVEMEIIEGYSPPSSPVDSDEEYYPQQSSHKLLSERVRQESAENLDTSEFDQSRADEDQSVTLFTSKDKQVGFHDNDSWSDEPQDLLREQFETNVATEDSANVQNTQSMTVSKINFLQDDSYDRESFDCDYEPSSRFDIEEKAPKNVKEYFLSDAVQTCNDKKEVPDAHHAFVSRSAMDSDAQQASSDFPPNPYSLCQKEQFSSIHAECYPGQLDSEMDQEERDGTDISADDIVSEPSDSFVDFMRECLKSNQDGKPGNDFICSENESGSMVGSSQAPQVLAIDLEHERLTISALKELGNVQEVEEKDEVALQTAVSTLGKSGHDVQFAQPSPPYPEPFQEKPGFDSASSKDADTIDVWVAEAYHLAEHVLTAILTHLSGNASFC
ncbi:reticulon-3 isoform X1 [Synchiropus splendidus]|uniref:reticulon-3 isoform X1 n=1 Tax=Synchiropus splendidus TaxID=270530 RepID=UPI00237D4B3B|nr:reticulon-3 isoform X1 [Synchiropus splendidus]XP_053716453.1 reticulon-3 isoform X1 [Synchiropus splendidus]XP_053716454.1 reticulon-3 isoform X1 [Synchiropus splendidus]XP_053716456.1 reticulon-3 isoform X1 [Synchiropus splendidus]